MKSEARVILERAEEFLASAENDRLDGRRPHACYEAARTAAELAGKAMLQHTRGFYPTKHAIGGDLFQANLLPKELEPRQVARLLRERTRADYGFREPVDEGELADAMAIARGLVEEARRRLGA